MTKRWDTSTSPSTEREDTAVDAFLAEITEVCRKHNMTIGHEDGHGAFEIHKDGDQMEYNLKWLNAAHIAKPESY